MSMSTLPPWQQVKDRPVVLEIIPANIPDRLKASPRWIVWKAELKPDGRINKPPYQARNTARPASTTNPNHLASFDEAIEACASSPDVAGIGYVVSPEEGLVFVDIDDCIEDGELSAEATAAVAAFASYTERSPSGTGIRIVAEGRIPHDFCNRVLHREMYSGGGTRYLTMTGQLIDDLGEIEDAQEALTHFHDMWKTRTNGKAPQQAIEAEIAPSVDLSRLSEYTLTIINGDWSAYGSRNEAVLGVCMDMIDAGYNDAEIIAVCTDRQFAISEAALDRRKSRESAAEWIAKYQLSEAHARVAARPKVEFSIEHLVDKSRKPVAGIPTTDTKAHGKQLPQFPPGFAGKLANEILANAIRPQPLFALSGALMAISLASQNYYRCAYMGGSVNLYMVQVGGTASGKDGPRKAIKDILSALKLDHLMPESIASGPALLRALGKQPAVCYSPDEFGLMLQTALLDKGSIHQKDLVAEMMRLYSLGDSFHGGKRYADDSSDVDKIERPYLCLFGSTTPTELTAALSQAQIDNGFLNRILYIETNQDKPPKNRDRKPGFDSSTIEQLRSLSAHANGIPASILQPRVIAFRDEARTLLDQFDDDCDTRVDGAMGSLWVRAHENAVRVAGCVALGMSEAIVTKDIAQWAIAFVSWCVQSMIDRLEADMASSPFEADAKRALKYIKRAIDYGADSKFGEFCAEGLMPKGLLTKLMHMRAKDLAQVIDYLADAEEIEKGEITVAGRQRKITAYKAAK